MSETHHRAPAHQGTRNRAAVPNQTWPGESCQQQNATLRTRGKAAGQRTLPRHLCTLRICLQELKQVMKKKHQSGTSTAAQETTHLAPVKEANKAKLPFWVTKASKSRAGCPTLMSLTGTAPVYQGGNIRLGKVRWRTSGAQTRCTQRERESPAPSNIAEVEPPW